MALNEGQNKTESLTVEELRKVIDKINNKQDGVIYNGKKYKFISMVDNKTDYVRLANKKGEPIFVEVEEFFKSFGFTLEIKSEIQERVQKVLKTFNFLNKIKLDHYELEEEIKKEIEKNGIDNYIKKIESDEDYSIEVAIDIIEKYILEGKSDKYKNKIPELRKKVLKNVIIKTITIIENDTNFDINKIKELLETNIKKLKELGVDVSEYENKITELRKELNENIYIKELNNLDFSNFESVLNWISKILTLKTYNEDSFNINKVIEKFEENGFYLGMNTGNNLKKNDPENSAKYLVGQALELIKNNYANMSGSIVNNWINEWKEKFGKTINKK